MRAASGPKRDHIDWKSSRVDRVQGNLRILSAFSRVTSYFTSSTVIGVANGYSLTITGQGQVG